MKTLKKKTVHSVTKLLGTVVRSYFLSLGLSVLFYSTRRVNLEAMFSVFLSCHLAAITLRRTRHGLWGLMDLGVSPDRP